MLRRLASIVVRRPWWVLAATLALLVLAGFLGGGVQERLKTGGFDDPRSDSAQARRLLDDHFAAAPDLADLVLLVRARTGDVDAPEVAAAGAAVTRDVAAEPDLSNVTSYWTTKSPGLRSRDGRSALVLAHVGGSPEQAARRAKQVADRLGARAGPVQVQAGGRTGLVSDLNAHVESDLALAESIAVPATLVLLVIAFGSVVAALLPLAIGLVSIVVTLLVLFLCATVTDVSVYALNIATAFGLGLAIDFGLLMVSRFREERDAGHEHRQAVVEAVAKAGRTILFSAATVSVALCGVLVFPLYFLRSIAIAAMAVVVLAALSAVVVLPALLSVLGNRIDSLALFRRRNGLAAESPFWRRTAAAVMRRPLRTAVPVIGVLLALGIPFLHATFAPADERALPTGSVSRQVSDALATEFTADNAKAVTVVTASGGASLDGLARRISAEPNVARVDGATGSYLHGTLAAEPGPESAEFTQGAAGFLLLRPSVDAQSAAAQDLVRTIRSLAPPDAGIRVGGPTAELIDSRSAIGDRLWLALGLMAAATFVLLFLFTGSLLLPLKALCLNVFTISAVLGTMTWLFQDGHLLHWLGSTPTPMNLAMVVLLCCISFGLSVDYELFLLGRIKEAHDAGASTTDAVAVGLGKVGRIVSTAAALLSVTLFSFATGLSFMQLFGLGTGLAVLLDATLIRGVLVPAFMRVAGDANWWAPAPLRRLHARIGLHEAPATRPPTVAAVSTPAPGPTVSLVSKTIPLSRPQIAVSPYIVAKRGFVGADSRAPISTRPHAAKAPRQIAETSSTGRHRAPAASQPHKEKPSAVGAEADARVRSDQPVAGTGIPFAADDVRLVALAFRLFAQRRFDECEPLFTELCGIAEFAAESHFRLGTISAARGALPAAIEHLRRCIARHPTHLDALDLLRTIAEDYAADPARPVGLDAAPLQPESEREPDQLGLRAGPGLGPDPTQVAVNGVHRDPHPPCRPGVGEPGRDVPQHLRLLRRQPSDPDS